ncbi:phosphotransferase enzyme family-domain-containing protein [Gloeopeniophorella convolvens]|nr:phosphotransferase enzyme family-domain-containing protein [Gloeopeniophorella convolvens]
MSHNPPQNGLEWKYELFDVMPTWTAEPDIHIARDIALLHLPAVAATYKIAFFAAGAFNKLYLIHPPDDSAAESFIMRVSLPVDPYFKTANEVATLNYVQKHTSIPVPRVIAYDASADNELGFEWILMSRLPGIALTSLWQSPEVSWEDRVQLTKTLAEYTRELTKFKSTLMGSLYPTNRPEFERVPWLKEAAPNIDFVPHPDDAEFVVGPVVTVPFFYGNRIQFAPNRGPFHTSSSYFFSLLGLHVASTVERKNIADADEDYDSDDVADIDDAKDAYQALLSLLPTFFPAAPEPESFVLFHDDLSTNNILIDPATHRITGVVDWECAALQPTWRAARVPQLLDGPDFDDGTPIPETAPPPDDKEEDEFRRERRDRIEQMLLRDVFYRELGGRPQGGTRERLFENKINQVEMRPSVVTRWAKGVIEGAEPFPTRGEGDFFFWPEH